MKTLLLPLALAAVVCVLPAATARAQYGNPYIGQYWSQSTFDPRYSYTFPAQGYVVPQYYQFSYRFGPPYGYVYQYGYQYPTYGYPVYSTPNVYVPYGYGYVTPYRHRYGWRGHAGRFGTGTIQRDTGFRGSKYSGGFSTMFN